MKESMVIYKCHCKQLKNEGLALEELNNYANFKNLFSKYEFECIIKEKQNRKNKRYRTKNKFMELYQIKDLLNTESYIVFGTITLDDKNLSKKENTYIRKIHSWLKEHFIYSILNKDYGSKTEREHYHFIGLTTEELESKGSKSKKGYEIYELVNKTYKMGFEPTLCLVDLQTNDIKKTTNYLLKLNNHSNKITTKNRVRVITNDYYDMLCMLTGINASKQVLSTKKRILDSI